MELLFELLFEFFVDGSVEALGNKKVPKPLRFVALIFLIVVLGGISALCIFSGIVEKNWILITAGILIIGVFAATCWKVLRHRH